MFDPCDAKKVVGTPFNLAHPVHVVYNEATGFEVLHYFLLFLLHVVGINKIFQGLPIEWQEQLKDAGISKPEVEAHPMEVLSVLEFHDNYRKYVPIYLFIIFNSYFFAILLTHIKGGRGKAKVKSRGTRMDGRIRSSNFHGITNVC